MLHFGTRQLETELKNRVTRAFGGARACGSELTPRRCAKDGSMFIQVEMTDGTLMLLNAFTVNGAGDATAHFCSDILCT